MSERYRFAICSSSATNFFAARVPLGKMTPRGYHRDMVGGASDWSVEQRGGARIFSPTGRVDETTATLFTERLCEVAASGGRIVLDLAGISYMSSRGLRALTLAHRRGADAGASIVLARPGETMREILAISRYDQVFRVADTIEDALGD